MRAWKPIAGVAVALVVITGAWLWVRKSQESEPARTTESAPNTAIPPTATPPSTTPIQPASASSQPVPASPVESTPPRKTSEPPPERKLAPAPAPGSAPLAGTEKSLGSPNAPIQIEVFSDYSCPVCRMFFQGVIRPMLDDYISTGKVYLIHRDFPLTGVIGHEHSREAALYETAAARIGRFQEVDAALYEKQPEWTRDGNVDAVVASVLSAKEMKRVREMVQGGQVDSYVNSDRSLGDSKGVRSTPTIYVTVRGRTEVLPGNVSYTLLRRYLDEQLQK